MDGFKHVHITKEVSGVPHYGKAFAPFGGNWYAWYAINYINLLILLTFSSTLSIMDLKLSSDVGSVWFIAVH